MKRLHIITKPMAIDALADMDADNVESGWQLRAERLQAKRMRKFKQQLA